MVVVEKKLVTWNEMVLNFWQCVYILLCILLKLLTFDSVYTY